MIVVIIANFITIRVVWQALGIEDYGIYNVVAGFVLMFDFMRSAMVAASQRYLAYGLGLNNQDVLSKYFKLSLYTFIKICIIIIIVGEIIGIWFINCKMNIPDQRIVAANIVYQISLFSFFISIVIVPYNACIVAHEDMNIYGYLGILEALFKLGTAYIIYFVSLDKLVIYALLQLLMYTSINLITIVFCRHKYIECKKYEIIRDKDLTKQIFSFASWSVIGNLGFSLRDQGLNLVINIFFSVTMNAAKAIGNQVAIAIRGFTSSFQMALNPQIVKNYASNNLDEMINLIVLGCKFSFFLLLIIVIPLFIKADYILTIWLKDINIYTVSFLRLSLILVLIESFSGPIIAGIQSTGKIKVFQIVISLVMISTIIISVVWIKINKDPYVVMWSSIITSTIGVIIRLYFLNKQVPIRYVRFLLSVFMPTLSTTILGYLIVYNIHKFFYNDISNLIYFSTTSTVILLGLIYIMGIQKQERKMINSYISSKATRIIHFLTK